MPFKQCSVKFWCLIYPHFGIFAVVFIDVNMVSEPKPLHGQAQNINRKRRLHQEDCHDRSSELQAARRRLLQGLPLMEQNGNRTLNIWARPFLCLIWRLLTFDLADKPDLLICGNCRELFFRLADIVDHKRHYCKLRLECKCNNSTPNHNNSNNLVEQNQPRQNDCQDRGQTLICSTCNNIFTDHWRLMFHAQMVHSLPIYELRSDRGHSKQSESPGGNWQEGRIDA